MKTPQRIWVSMVAAYGDYEARRRLRYYRLERQAHFVRVRRCHLALASEIIQCASTPVEGRKKYFQAIRSLVHAHRMQRLRIESFLLPGQPRTRIPG